MAQDLTRSNKGIVPIGVFDSGYGGLTILKALRAAMPEYDWLYLGDNARAPYGSRSVEVVHKFTLQAVTYLFAQGAPLVIVACNTASAKALRTIQQRDLPGMPDPTKRVLGIIRPTVEALDGATQTKHIGILATEGTVASESYPAEIDKLYKGFSVTQEACPMWVPLVESGEAEGEGADWFIRKHLTRLLARDAAIDTVLLACTHYPLLREKIRRYLPEGISLLEQGAYVAPSLQDYLRRHPEMACRLSRKGTVRYLTTEAPDTFSRKASLFVGNAVQAAHVDIDKAKDTLLQH